MDKRNFSILQSSLDEAGIYTAINRLGKNSFEVLVNYQVHSRCKTRLTAKRRVIDIANEVFKIRLDRYQ